MIQYQEKKTKVLGEKPIPVPLCQPQTPQRLAWDRTLISALRTSM